MNIKFFKKGGKKDTRIAIKAGFGYTIGNISIKGISFLTLPIFSRIMTPSQFGMYNVFISYEAILYVIIGLAIHTSIQSARLEFNNEVNKYVSSVSLIYICNFILFNIIVFCFGDYLSSLFDFSKEILYLLVLFSFGTSIIQLYNNKVSLNYEYKKYLIVSFIYSIGNILLSLVFMFSVLNDNKALGRMLGTSVTSLAAAIFVLYSLYKEALPKFNKHYWSFALKYSLPIVPHGISQVLLSQFDRIMIRTIIGNSAAGIYSFATNIKLILTVITDSLITTWRTWFFQALSENKVEEIQKRAIQILELYTILSIGLMSISHELILLLGGIKYDSAKYVVIPMILDAFLLFIYGVIVQSEYYAKKTHFIMIGTIIAASINIITNYFFIQKYGFIVAAYTTLFSYIIYLVLHLFISYRVVKFAVIPYKSLFIYLTIVVFDGILNLIFVDMLVARLSINFIIILLMSFHFLKSIKYLSNIKIFK